MGSVVEVLRAARERRGLSQAEVARRIGTSQPAVARLEGGGAEPLLGTAERYANAVGLQLRALEVRSTRGGVHVGKTAAAVAGALAVNDADGAFRRVVQLIDGVERLPIEEAHGVLMAEPDTTGSRRWDALLGAAGEYAARRAGGRPPGWTAAPSRFLDEFWAPVEDMLGFLPRRLACMLFATSPPEFSIRGVLIDPASLRSV